MYSISEPLEYQFVVNGTLLLKALASLSMVNFDTPACAVYVVFGSKNAKQVIDSAIAKPRDKIFFNLILFSPFLFSLVVGVTLPQDYFNNLLVITNFASLVLHDKCYQQCW